MLQQIEGDIRYIIQQLSFIVQICDTLHSEDPAVLHFRRMVVDSAVRILDAVGRIVSAS